MTDDEILEPFNIPVENPTPEKYYRQGGSELDKFVAEILMSGSGRISLNGFNFDEAYQSKEVELFTVTAQCEPKDSILNLCHEMERLCPQGIDAWNGMIVQFCVDRAGLPMECVDHLHEWVVSHHLSSNFVFGLYRLAEQPMARVIVYR